MTSRAIVDTSVLIAGETGRQVDTEAIPENLAVSVITLGELRAGVLAAADTAQRDRRLRTLAGALILDLIPVTAEIADRWAALRVLLLESGERMGVNDSWIAATAMALGVPVLTQDTGFPEIGGLAVIRV